MAVAGGTGLAGTAAVETLATETLVLVAAIVFVGGFVKGLVGFGYAVASTAVLAVVLAPATAIVVMILPTLVANVVLLRELGRKDFTECFGRFWPYLVAAVAGTVVGMLFLRQVPTAYVALGLGVVTLGYVLGKQPWVELPGERALGRSNTDGVGAKSVLGLLSGVVFGATNIAVQVVTYLDSLDLDRSTFVGVLAMILVGISGLRILLAAGLGLYSGSGTAALSVVAALPGLAGVKTGGLARRFVPDRVQLVAVLVLLSVIGLRLTSKGLAGL